jgi:glycosyltransferase involved in cell wall biosynthesis
MNKVIKYVGFNESTGYGIAARTMMTALENEASVVHWVPVTAGTMAYDPYSVPQVREGYKNVIVHLVPEYYPVWLEFERAKDGESKQIWGYTTWETDKIPAHWPELLNMMDGIFVPCEWNRRVFRDCGVMTRIEVLPHISQFHGQASDGLASPRLHGLAEEIDKRYVFYNVGAWSERKAPWLVIDAFLSEFMPDERVVLIVKSGKHDFTVRRRKWYKPWQFGPGKTADTFRKIAGSAAKKLQVIHLDEEMSDNDMAGLHEMGDCFVSLAHGEGWGMGSYEAAWWGKPVITTGIGGALDYLPGNLSCHVRYELVPVRCLAGGRSYTSDQYWAEPDLGHARQLMRKVYEDRKWASEMGMGLREHVARKFNPACIAGHLLAMLGTE